MIVDANGKPFDRQALSTRQTAESAWRHSPLRPIAGSLTPASLRGALAAADQGDLLNQHRLFAEMEDTDAHLSGEIGKRKLALLTLDWDIVPPPRATAQEKKHADWLKETLTDAVDPLDDLILALMDGPGHGFAAVELAWSRAGREWLPGFLPRPQDWFCLPRSLDTLRLADGSAEGSELWPFGWVKHVHGAAKTGALGRLGLYRALLRPWLYKQYSVGDLAEFIEAYGLPFILGRYNDKASEDEKASLLQAVVDLGHDARAIMPAQMSIEIQKVTSGGDGVPHLALIDWCERAESKLILGQVLSAEAKATGLGSGVAQVHNDVRHDILESDARRIGATLTRDLCYPLLAINWGLESLSRCPRLVFDTSQPEDLTAYADALPKLVQQGLRISVEWVHERLGIPIAGDGEDILRSTPVGALGDAPPTKPEANPPRSPAPERVSALAAGPARLAADLAAEDPAQAALNAALADLPGGAIDAAMRALLAPAIAALQAGESPDEAGDAVLAAFPSLDSRELEDLLARAIFVADVWGRISAADA
ncbi:DUF935 domain-containing protein [Accumulibacter sp.]|uniref:DUF935 domain-containing protein n=1 Tax=Accumulibacter sp. TaxID=2053492 RepID=UPI002878756E|nr:DUF935 domain-containing protein [Accumulibacter sp.]MDS4056447.1 DUF935 domain-containing protein [Accumulibacter sp.]HMW55141.1 DUF935 domain-containing protein [Accumulibacter sp.]HMW79185.1 DUF935 domain-containing protein [Accumulibacter sp.]